MTGCIIFMDYKSPNHKLLKFFISSRDKWKLRAKAAKKEVKLCKNRIAFLEESKAKQKAKISKLEKQLSATEKEEIPKPQTHAIEVKKKKTFL